MCPFANTTNIIVIASLILVVFLVDIASRRVAAPGWKKFLKILYYILYISVLGIIVFIFLSGSGYV